MKVRILTSAFKDLVAGRESDDKQCAHHSVKDKCQLKSKPRPVNQGYLGKIIFDVPVYRLSQPEYEAKQEQYVRQNLAEGEPYPDSKGKLWWQTRFAENYGGFWQFNEIIGFIRLFFYGTQIRGEYWRVNAKRLVRTRNKTFVFRELNVTFGEQIPPRSSNKRIFNLILKYLKRAESDCFFRGQFIDTSILEYIGPYVDWKSLLTPNHQTM
jgi:hypothetical protein